VSTDDPQSPPKLTDYEKSLIDALREERRRQLGIETGAVAATQPAEPPVADVAPVPPPLAPEESTENLQPARVEPIPAPIPEPEPTAPLSVRPSSPPPAIPRKRPRLTLILLGSLLAIALAAVALAILNSSRRAATSASEMPPAPPPPVSAKAQPPEEVKVPLQNAAADLERLFADYPADRANGRAGFRQALADPALSPAERERYLEVSGNRIRVRSLPAESATVMRTLRRGAYVRLNERAAGGDWCAIALPDRRAGWMKCAFLKPIEGPESDAAVQARTESRGPARQR